MWVQSIFTNHTMNRIIEIAQGSMAMTAYSTTYLKDYRPPNYFIETVELQFDLGEELTTVTNIMILHRNENVDGTTDKLVLAGEKLVLKKIKLNQTELKETEYEVNENELVIFNPPEQFSLTIVTEIYPQNNTELTGLYKSNNIFCTQCEAEGFRRITYYLDRPDVMAIFTTKIIADKSKYPILLSNGNLMSEGNLDNNRRIVVWQDPFKKPAYLFALVAGDLECLSDNFITQSGRDVSLKIYVEKGNIAKTNHAMEAVKHAMRWDEIAFGREYDLDIYMIVAVNDFNMGAMENKGLNIFNTKYILANTEIATDADYQGILSVIGHEYFHNWSGNRVTCRDWFQLSLKEGLTIYRDQEFTADMTSRVVARIGNVRNLRTFQFPEDAGPLAHPVQPDSYIEINNFYTHTIYEKGAEVIRMIKTLVGVEGFRLGMDLYFNRHDGQAVTIEEFVKAMEDANGIDLKQFRLWYKQAGTPQLTITSSYDATNKTFTLSISQYCPPTPGQTDKKPLHIPVVISLLDQNGNQISLERKSASNNNKAGILEVKNSTETFEFLNVAQPPIPVLLEDFSAPVQLVYDYSDDDLHLMATNAKDLFSRWEAFQSLFLNTVKKLLIDYRSDNKLLPNPLLAKVFAENLTNKDLDEAFIAELLTPPSEKYICGMQSNIIDIDAIHHIHRFILQQIALDLQSLLLERYQALAQRATNQTDQFSMTARQLKNVCLHYLTMIEQHRYIELSFKQYHQSENMTDRLAALRAIANSNDSRREDYLGEFYFHWQFEPLVVDKWFSLQATSTHENVFSQVLALTKHEAFTIKNPNRVRSLIGAFSSNNLFYFHRPDGAGYEFLREYVVKLDALNPQIAARLLEPMTTWRRYDVNRQALMQKQLELVRAVKGLSNDVYEVVSKTLE